jgi:hypothetical protein
MIDLSKLSWYELYKLHLFIPLEMFKRIETYFILLALLLVFGVVLFILKKYF